MLVVGFPMFDACSEESLFGCVNRVRRLILVELVLLLLNGGRLQHFVGFDCVGLRIVFEAVGSLLDDVRVVVLGHGIFQIVPLVYRLEVVVVLQMRFVIDGARCCL